MVPDWCPWFTTGQWDHFRALVEAVLRLHGYDRPRVELSGVAVVAGADGQQRHFGLAGLAGMAQETPEADWPVLIDAHFAGIATAEAEAAELDGAGLDVVRPLLRARVHRAGDMPAGAEPVYRPLGADLIEVLYLDLPSVVRTVGPDRVTRWDADVDALFWLGRENLRGEETDATVIEAAPGVPVHVDTGPHGALAVVPNRHMLAYHPIRDLSAVRAVTGLAQFALSQYGSAGSLSPSLYWWRAGQATQIPAEITDDKITITPPEAFVDVLNALPAPPE